MRQGEIDNDQAWFGFTLEQLFWLLDRIPARDNFRDEIWQAIKKLDEGTARNSVNEATQAASTTKAEG